MTVSTEGEEPADGRNSTSRVKMRMTGYTTHRPLKLTADYLTNT
jgi:hypothetical protein